MNLRVDEKAWYQRCDARTKSKGPRRRTKDEMSQYDVGAPFEKTAVDLAGPFPGTPAVN